MENVVNKNSANTPSLALFFLTSLRILSPITWLLSTLALILFFFWFQWKHNENEFIKQAIYAHNEVNQIAEINVAILDGFSSFIRAQTNEPESEIIIKYSSEVINDYPHIYMMNSQNIWPGSTPLQFDWLQGSKHKIISSDGENVPHGSAKDYLYASIDYENSTAESADNIVEMEAASTNFLQHALLSAIKSGRPTASKSFPLFDGSNAYVLFKALDKNADFSLHNNNQTKTTAVSLLIKTKQLLKYASNKIPQADSQLLFTNIHGEKISDIEQASQTSSYWIPLQDIIYQKSLTDFGQSFTLKFTLPHGLSRQDGLLAALMLSISIIIGWIYHINLYKRHISDLSRDLAINELEEERHNLEKHVANRTEELEKTNRELKLAISSNKKLSQKIITVQEDDYRHIAQELHDEFGQNITAIKINAKILEQTLGNTPYDQDSLSDIKKVTDLLYDSMQNMVRRLRPESLDTFGLKTSIENCILAFKLKNHGITCELHLSDEIDSIRNEYAVTAYRAVQELTNNIIKHGHASTIKIRLELTDNTLFIQVADNGVGMRTDDFSGGFGLLGIQERVSALNGTLEISSKPNDGCIITIRLKIEKM